MASSCCNSSTPVSPLGIPFNMILCFSDQMAYLPNTPQYSRWIHQRGHSSLRSPSSTIQSGWIDSPVPSPSIISVDNDPNWEDAFANPITNTTTANKPISFTYSWSKPHWSENTNEQLADVLGRLANTLNSNQIPTSEKQLNTLWMDLSSKLASNSKLTSDECNNYLKNDLCLYYSAKDYKLDSCSKKQTMVSPKGHGASATASEKPLEK